MIAALRFRVWLCVRPPLGRRCHGQNQQWGGWCGDGSSSSGSASTRSAPRSCSHPPSPTPIATSVLTASASIVPPAARRSISAPPAMWTGAAAANALAHALWRPCWRQGPASRGAASGVGRLATRGPAVIRSDQGDPLEGVPLKGALLVDVPRAGAHRASARRADCQAAPQASEGSLERLGAVAVTLAPAGGF